MTLASTYVDQKRHGKHYTPQLLADFLAERALANVRKADRITVLDPACGDGELLLAIHRVAARNGSGVELELNGFDLDSAAIDMARERAEALGVRVQLEAGDFFDLARRIDPHTIDVVIANPPYVRTQHLGGPEAQRLAREFGLSGRVDLTHPFVAAVPGLLSDAGVFALLCSNRFMTTRAGANIRRVFRDTLAPIEVFDLGDTRLFGAAVLPAIVIAGSTAVNQAADCRFVSAYEGPETPTSGATLFDALTAARDVTLRLADRSISVRAGSLHRSRDVSEPWRMAHAVGDQWLDRVRDATWKSFGDVARIRVGIKTTADSVFISDDWDSMPHHPEPDVLLPLITHKNITAWSLQDRVGTRVLYPYDLSKTRRPLVNLDEYPEARKYLDANSERLKSRAYVVAGGREWHEIWVPQRPADWAAPKIVFPDISVEARFALDTSGAIVNGDCYWISLDDIGSDDVAHLMVAVANSRLGQRYYDEVCGNKLYSGRRRWMSQYVARLPLPDPTTEASREVIRSAREIVEAGGTDAQGKDALSALVEAAFTTPLRPGAASASPTLF